MNICRIPINTIIYNCFFDDVKAYYHPNINGTYNPISRTQYELIVDGKKAREFILDTSFTWVQLEKHNIWILVATKDVERYYIKHEN